MQTSGKNNECEQENFSLSEGAFLGQGGPESKHSVSVEGKGLGHVGTCSSPNMSHYPIMKSQLWGVYNARLQLSNTFFNVPFKHTDLIQSSFWPTPRLTELSKVILSFERGRTIRWKSTVLTHAQWRQVKGPVWLKKRGPGRRRDRDGCILSSRWNLGGWVGVLGFVQLTWYFFKIFSVNLWSTLKTFGILLSCNSGFSFKLWAPFPPQQ